MTDEHRLNHATERRLDSMALVVLLFNDSKIEVPSVINEHLDELGQILLSHFKKTKHLTSEQTAEVVSAFAAMMDKRVKDIRNSMKPHEGERAVIEAKAERNWS